MELTVGLLVLSISKFTAVMTSRDEQERVAELTGVPAKVTDAPYTVALVKTRSSAGSFKDEKPFCTGSIIDPEWVLTAAHCILTPEIPNSMTSQISSALMKCSTSPGLPQVVAGADNVNQFSNADVQRKTVKELHMHPLYWKDRVSKYDVAVLHVDKFEFNKRVNLANLWAKPWVKAPQKAKVAYGTQECRVYGWGALEVNAPSDVLRTVTLNVVHGEKACPCYKMYQQRRLVCSRDKAGYLCFGDSGGPLVCEEKTVAGVAHVLYHRKTCSSVFFGKIKLKCNDPLSVSAWMYVCPMLDFIHEHVPSAPDRPASCESPPLPSTSTMMQCVLPLAIVLVLT